MWCSCCFVLSNQITLTHEKSELLRLDLITIKSVIKPLASVKNKADTILVLETRSLKTKNYVRTIHVRIPLCSYTTFLQLNISPCVGKKHGMKTFPSIFM